MILISWLSPELSSIFLFFKVADCQSGSPQSGGPAASSLKAPRAFPILVTLKGTMTSRSRSGSTSTRGKSGSTLGIATALTRTIKLAGTRTGPIQEGAPASPEGDWTFWTLKGARENSACRLKGYLPGGQSDGTPSVKKTLRDSPNLREIGFTSSSPRTWSHFKILSEQIRTKARSTKA
jgi:hypothetical protein